MAQGAVSTKESRGLTQERVRLFARLPEFTAIARGEGGDLKALHAELCAELDALGARLRSVVSSGAPGPGVLEAGHAHSLLQAVETNLYQMTGALQASLHSDSVGGLLHNLVEGLDAVLFLAADAFADGSRSDVTMVLEVTADRGDLMERLRNNYLDHAIKPEDRPTLFYVTTLFERTIWLLQRSADLWLQGADAITALHLLEGEQLARQGQRQQERLRAKDAFLANLSHEIRTPLHAILNFAGNLERTEGLPHEVQEAAGLIRRSGQGLLGLLNNLLAVAKLDAGQESPLIERFDLPELLHDLSALFAVKVRGKGVAWLARLDSLPRWVEGDGGKLRQIALNLLSNASKFTSQGEIELRAHHEDDRLTLQVRDSGPGIHPDEAELVFQTFEQTSSGLQSGGGSGLGMALSLRYARLLGGDLEFSSQPGVGTVFTLTLPLHAPPQEQTARRDPQAEESLLDLSTLPATLRAALRSAAAHGDQEALQELLPQLPAVAVDLVNGFDHPALMAALDRNLAEPLPVPPADDRPTLLLVDDNSDNLRILQTTLRCVGLHLLFARSGLDALRIARAYPPALVLLDVLMPGMDGIEVCQLLKEDALTREAPVILLSALDTLGDKLRGLEAGACDYIVKPFQVEEVLARVKTQLAMREMQDDLRRNNQQLSLLNSQKNELLGMVAHDLRNPLTVIHGYCKVLQGNALGPLNERQTNSVQQMQQAGERMLSMIDDLLDASALEAGRLELRRQLVDPRTILDRSLHTLSVQAEAKRIELVGEIVEPLPEWISADSHKLQQVMENLLSNAVKYSQSDTVVRARLSTDSEGQLRWDVQDQGQGIPADELGKVFEPFQKTSTRATAGEKSTGLGLAIARKIVEGHGGDIRVQSQQGQGSCFTVTLPVPAGPSWARSF